MKSYTTGEFFLKGSNLPVFVDEFWTSGQRKSSSIHEISYRACFKAQLPSYFITRYTDPGDIVYDPFSGRGTTVIEAGLLGRKIISNDVNPLSRLLAEPRFIIPNLEDLRIYLDEIELEYPAKAEIDLSMFYHPKTEAEIVSLKQYLLKKEKDETLYLDKWIRMVATNRLTGHSSGFFSVYTLPPNQAVSQESQRKINQKRNQSPEYRDVKKIILKKSKSLLRNITEIQKSSLLQASKDVLFLNENAADTKVIPNESVNLIVTSPPFLNVVQYGKDNWLRCWFNGIDINEVEKKISVPSTIEDWSKIMYDVFVELYRITKKNGRVAFEVGEVKKGKIKLDEIIVPIGINAGFECEKILINKQSFTKTSNIWGIKNNSKGTNSNRIVLFQKK